MGFFSRWTWLSELNGRLQNINRVETHCPPAKIYRHDGNGIFISCENTVRKFISTQAEKYPWKKNPLLILCDPLAEIGVNINRHDMEARIFLSLSSQLSSPSTLSSLAPSATGGGGVGSGNGEAWGRRRRRSGTVASTPGTAPFSSLLDPAEGGRGRRGGGGYPWRWRRWRFPFLLDPT